MMPGATIASRPGEGTVPNLVTSEAQLEAIYGQPAGPALEANTQAAYLAASPGAPLPAVPGQHV